MKNIFLFLTILFSLHFISCSKINNPVTIENNYYPVSHCEIDGLEIDFADTCSYNFVMSFMSAFDSVIVRNTDLGGTFRVHPDSGSYDYWQNYFANDSTIDFIYPDLNSPDSLILIIHVSGKRSIEEEKERILQTNHLEIISIEEDSKSVYVTVPENRETEWKENFKQYSFITEVFIIAVCTES